MARAIQMSSRSKAIIQDKGYDQTTCFTKIEWTLRHDKCSSLKLHQSVEAIESGRAVGIGKSIVLYPKVKSTHFCFFFQEDSRCTNRERKAQGDQGRAPKRLMERMGNSNYVHWAEYYILQLH